MSDEVRVRLSGAWIVLAIAHAALSALVFTALRPAAVPCPADCGCTAVFRELPHCAPTPVEKLPEPPVVNLEAQGELKHAHVGAGVAPAQIFPRLFNRRATGCNVNTTTRTAGSTAVAAPASKSAKSSEPSKSPFADASTGGSSIAAPSTPPPKVEYQLALFVGNDARSRRLVEWFEQDEQLARLRENCEFQLYTGDNPLYRTRFKEIVPIEQFPVVLFQDCNGGHIHAAGRAMIPDTAAELYDDLEHGYRLYHQALQAEKTGAIKARGYSWDESITPSMTLFGEDCPDGRCPTDPPDRWRPGSRVRDTLFDRPRDDRNAFIRASANELATIALSVIALLLLGFIVIKRGY